MKNRILAAACAALLSLPFCFAPAKALAAEKELVLRVHNWQDYINEDYVFSDPETNFESWYRENVDPSARVRVEYTTFGTNENLYNDMKIGKGKYDLVCPSDYMIEKMMNEDMLDPVDFDRVRNYTDYGSPIFEEAFEDIGTAEKNVGMYAVGYMWGTMGFVFNPDKVEASDLESWLGAWKEDYKGKITIKDSVRDTYFMGVAAARQDELLALRAEYLGGNKSTEAYKSALAERFNDVTDDTLSAVEKKLREQNRLLFGYELDSGKNDMVSGKIDLNFCWSGDAVYTMDQAEDGPDELTDREKENYEPSYLAYSVPLEGTNLWFDGWVMPKGRTEEQKALAEAFLDYLSEPATAAANMEEIGYTSAIAGDAIFELLNDWYGAEDGAEETYEVDLTYFFDGTLSEENLTDGRAIVYTEEERNDRTGRQFFAQYPPEEVIDRSVVMRDFGDRNDALLDMWLRVKGNALPLWAILAIVFGAIAACLLVWGISKLVRSGKLEIRRRPPKGYTLVGRK